MSVLDHQKEQKVQVWNGVSYAYVSEEDANELESKGTHQITTNLSAKDLLTKDQFKEKQSKAKDEDGGEETPSPANRRKKKPKTTEAKPADSVFPYETKSESPPE